MTEEAKPPVLESGVPDGTVPPAGVPLEIITQRIPVPNPESGEQVRAALEPYEEDGIVRDKKSGGWIYVRTRVFVKMPPEKEIENDRQMVGTDNGNGNIDTTS